MSRPVTLALVAAGAALLSACGTGLEAQTYKESGRADGANATLGTLALRNLHVTAPEAGPTISAKGQAVLVGLLANPGDEADALVSASTDVASSVELQDAGKATSTVVVPAGGAASNWSIVLTGLTKDLRPGTYISVTLAFQKAPKTTVQVPVRAGENGLGTRPEAQNPYGE